MCCYICREEVYGRWNGLPASREATSLTIIRRLPTVHDQIEQPPLLYLVSCIFYIIYIYITNEWGVSLYYMDLRSNFRIWVLGLLHFLVSRSTWWRVVIKIVRMWVLNTMVGFPSFFKSFSNLLLDHPSCKKLIRLPEHNPYCWIHKIWKRAMTCRELYMNSIRDWGIGSSIWSLRSYDNLTYTSCSTSHEQPWGRSWEASCSSYTKNDCASAFGV